MIAMGNIVVVIVVGVNGWKLLLRLQNFMMITTKFDNKYYKFPNIYIYIYIYTHIYTNRHICTKEHASFSVTYTSKNTATLEWF